MRRRGQRGQSSIEYLLIVTFALLLIVPGTLLFLRYTNDSQTAVIGAQVFSAGNELIDTAELMYSIGENSWQTIDVNFPDPVTSVRVYNGTVSELVITYGESLQSDAVFFTTIPLYNTSASDCSQGCSLSVGNGNFRIRVEAVASGGVVYRVVR